MDKVKVEIFGGIVDDDDLQEEINQWLNAHPLSKIDIRHICQSESGHDDQRTMAISIWYVGGD